MYKKYNTYFVVSALWFTFHFIFTILDESKQLVNNDLFMFGMLVSLLNLAFACYLGTQTPDNYYQDDED